MGGGQVTDDFSTDPSDSDLSKLLVVSESTPEDGSVLEVTCDLGLHQKPATLVADDVGTHLAELQMVSESYPEDESVLEVNSDLGLQQKSARTLVLVGRSGNGKSATGNSILGKQAFKSRGRASGVTTVCELQSSMLSNGEIVNVIDTPGLFSMDPSTEFTCREILRCLSLSKEGIDAVLLVFSLRNRLTEEEKSVLFALMILFGSKIVDYMIVIFTNEDFLEDEGDTFEEYLNDSSDFEEILKACNDRKVLFGNRVKAPESQKVKQVQELLNYVEEIARKNGKPYLGDLSQSIRENETAYQEKEREILEMKNCFTKLEMSHLMKNMKKSYEEELLNQMMERVETKLKETLKTLEQQLSEEQAMRLELEKRANEVEKNSCDVVKKLNTEQAARLELEKRAMEVEKNSSDVINKLSEDLENAVKMTKEFEEKKGWCIIL